MKNKYYKNYSLALISFATACGICAYIFYLMVI